MKVPPKEPKPDGAYKDLETLQAAKKHLQHKHPPVFTDQDLEAIKKHLFPVKRRAVPTSLLDPLSDNYLRRELELYAAPVLGLGPKEYGKKAEQGQTDLRSGLKDMAKTMSTLLEKVDKYLVDYIFGDSLAVDKMISPVKVRNALVCMREDAKILMNEAETLLDKLPRTGRPPGPADPQLNDFYRGCLKLFDTYNPSTPASDIIKRESYQEEQGKPLRNRVVLFVMECLKPVNRQIKEKNPKKYPLHTNEYALNKKLLEILSGTPPKA